MIRSHDHKSSRKPCSHRSNSAVITIGFSVGANSFLARGRVQLKCDGTRWRTGGEVKGKLANGVGSQYSHTTSEHDVASITTADAHTSAASSRLN
jgi:hypothetical protein